MITPFGGMDSLFIFLFASCRMGGAAAGDIAVDNDKLICLVLFETRKGALRGEALGPFSGERFLFNQYFRSSVVA